MVIDPSLVQAHAFLQIYDGLEGNQILHTCSHLRPLYDFPINQNASRCPSSISHAVYTFAKFAFRSYWRRNNISRQLRALVGVHCKVVIHESSIQFEVVYEKRDSVVGHARPKDCSKSRKSLACTQHRRSSLPIR